MWGNLTVWDFWQTILKGLVRIPAELWRDREAGQ